MSATISASHFHKATIAAPACTIRPTIAAPPAPINNFLAPTVAHRESHLLVDAQNVTPTNKWYRLVMNRQAYITIGLTALGAIIISCQSLSIGRGLVALGTGNFHLVAAYVGLYLLTGYVARGLNDHCNDTSFQKWNQVALSSFMVYVNEVNHGRPEVLAMDQHRNNISTINHQAKEKIELITRIIKDGVSYGIGLLSNMTVIASIVSAWLIPVLIVTVLLLVLYIGLRYAHRDVLAQQQETANQTAAVNIKTETFRNLLRPKVGNEQQRRQNIRAHQAASIQANHKMNMRKRVDSFWMNTLICIPCIGALTYAATLGLESAQNVIAATPSTASFIDQLLKVSKMMCEWFVARGKINRMVELVQPADMTEWNTQITALREANSEEIEITHEGEPVSLDELDKNPQQLPEKKGRWSISSKNGKYKKTLLLAIAKYFTQKGEQQLGYWSPQLATVLKNTEGDLTDKDILDQIQVIGNLPSNILILDNWDTLFHDKKNIEVLDKQIKEWAKIRPVIEVRQEQGVELRKLLNGQKGLIEKQKESTEKQKESTEKRKGAINYIGKLIIEQRNTINKQKALTQKTIGRHIESPNKQQKSISAHREPINGPAKPFKIKIFFLPKRTKFIRRRHKNCPIDKANKEDFQ